MADSVAWVSVECPRVLRKVVVDLMEGPWALEEVVTSVTKLRETFFDYEWEYAVHEEQG
jgi:hypothetical protein